jgi:hypothetical protein
MEKRGIAGGAAVAGSVLAFVAATLLLAGAALYNGYPLVHFDTGTYVSSSFTFGVPLRRPVAYGLFLAATHLGLTLWTVVLAQAAILTALIRRLLTPSPRRDVALVVVAAGLAFLTTSPWFVGVIMPDALTGACLLALFLLLRRPATSRWVLFLEGALLVVTAATHYSHPPIVISLVIVAQIAKLLFPRLELALKPAWIAAIAAGLAIPTLNLILTGEFFYTKSAHAFLLGRMVNDGLVNDLLAEKCGDNQYSLCPHREELLPKGQSFLWDQNSVFQRTGGWTAPAAPAWKIIVDSVVYTPARHLATFVTNTFQLLPHFDCGELAAYSADEFVAKMLRVRFPGEVEAFARSHQQQATLPYLFVLTIPRWVVWGSAALSALILLAGLLGARAPALDLHVFVAAALIVNAAIMSNFSAVASRYEARIIWLLPLATLVTAAEWWSTRGLRAAAVAPADARREPTADALQPSLAPGSGV